MKVLNATELLVLHEWLILCGKSKNDYVNFTYIRLMFCVLLCDGLSGAATREVQDYKIYYTPRSERGGHCMSWVTGSASGVVRWQKTELRKQLFPWPFLEWERQGRIG